MPETNIVMFDLLRPGHTAADFVRRLAEQGVLFTEFSRRRLRAVTHLDVDAHGIRLAADALRRVAAAPDSV